MLKLQCPHCGRRGVSFLQKMCMGPVTPTRCKACGKELGVPYIAVLAVVPFLSAIFLSSLITFLPLKIVWWTGGFLMMSFIHVCLIPLEAR